MIAAKTINQALLEQPTHSIIVCALACEAKPFIDTFKLKKQRDIHAFSVYRAGSMVVMVSGLGQINMAAAVNWLCAYLNSSSPQFWLNIGVAGHASADIGDLFCIHKITAQQQSLYPTKWLRHKIALEQLSTFNGEETGYKKRGLYDMEGFAFYQAATRFKQQECVQCLKVVSDNKNHAINKDKQFISELIARNMDAILAFITLHTSAIAQHYDEPLLVEWQQTLMQNIHFSYSQQVQLSKFCQAMQSHCMAVETLNFKDLNEAKEVLKYLKMSLAQMAVEI